MCVHILGKGGLYGIQFEGESKQSRVSWIESKVCVKVIWEYLLLHFEVKHNMLGPLSQGKITVTSNTERFVIKIISLFLKYAPRPTKTSYHFLFVIFHLVVLFNLHKYTHTYASDQIKQQFKEFLIAKGINQVIKTSGLSLEPCFLLFITIK